MKVRISEEHLRFRLGPEDLARLPEAPLCLNLELHLGLSWTFQLEVGRGAFLVEAEGSTLKVHLPRQDALDWLTSKELEWNFEQASPPLRISVEKDVKPNRERSAKSRSAGSS